LVWKASGKYVDEYRSFVIIIEVGRLRTFVYPKMEKMKIWKRRQDLRE